MSASYEEPPRRRIETEAELWLALGARVSEFGKEMRRNGKDHYVAAGEAMLWTEMCWVIVHDDLHPTDRALGMSIKWQPVSAEGTNVVPDSVNMHNGAILSLDVGSALERADFVLDNTRFGILEPNVESGVAALWGFGPIAK